MTNYNILPIRDRLPCSRRVTKELVDAQVGADELGRIRMPRISFCGKSWGVTLQYDNA